jgi:hypothetical protein
MPFFIQHNDHHCALCECTHLGRREYAPTERFLERLGFLEHTILVMLVARWDHKHVRFRKHKTGNSTLERIASDLIHDD